MSCTGANVLPSSVYHVSSEARTLKERGSAGYFSWVSSNYLYNASESPITQYVNRKSKPSSLALDTLIRIVEGWLRYLKKSNSKRPLPPPRMPHLGTRPWVAVRVLHGCQPSNRNLVRKAPQSSSDCLCQTGMQGETVRCVLIK